MSTCIRTALVVILLTTFLPAAPPSRLDEQVRTLKTNLALQQRYRPDTGVELELEPDQAALLTFTENGAGVTEFLFHNTDNQLRIIYACRGESYNATRLTSQRTRDSRTFSRKDAPEWMRCTTDCEFNNGSVRLTFTAETIDAEGIRKLKEASKKAREARMDERRRVLAWDETAEVPSFEMRIPGPDDPSLQRLRKEYNLDKVVEGAADDYERLHRIAKWTHDRWKHSGDNRPSNADPLTILAEAKEGKRFRCVEYAIVVTACAQSLGMPARRLALKREDVETARSGAGHIVAEVWLDSHKKWVFVDGQWDVIPELDGKPLSAVEFQDAIGRKKPGLTLRSSSEVEESTYLYWVAPYLYYFDTNLNQDCFGRDSDHAEENRRAPRHGKIMLVPKGATKPKVFQRNSPIRNCTYISSPKAFYPDPVKR